MVSSFCVISVQCVRQLICSRVYYARNFFCVTTVKLSRVPVTGTISENFLRGVKVGRKVVRFCVEWERKSIGVKEDKIVTLVSALQSGFTVFMRMQIGKKAKGDT